MLNQVLAELKSAESVLNLNDLSHKLDIDRSALEGMILDLVEMGKLQDGDKAAEVAIGMCDSGSCSASCPGPTGCPFVMKLPRTFSLTTSDSD